MHTPQLRTKAHEELRALHSGPTGSHKVTNFVQENRNQKSGDKYQTPNVAHAKPDQQCNDGNTRQDRDGLAWFFGVGARLIDGPTSHHFVSEGSIQSH